MIAAEFWRLNLVSSTYTHVTATNFPMMLTYTALAKSRTADNFGQEASTYCCFLENVSSKILDVSLYNPNTSRGNS